VLPLATTPGLLAASLVLIDEGAPYDGLRRLVGGLSSLARQRGATSLQVPGPSRYWDATRVLLDAGLRPRASFLRLTRQGFPERGDLRRVHLTSWR
jgi:hypothetical protein